MKKFLLTLGAMALFAAPSFAQDGLAENQQEVEAYYQNTDRADVLNVTDLVITRNEGNTYTVKNAFNSGSDFSFKFDLSEIDGNGWCPIYYVAIPDIFVENADAGGFTDFIMYTPDRSMWTISNLSGGSVTMDRVCFREGSAWLNPQDNEDGMWYDYYAELYVWAETYADGNYGWSDANYMTFYFDETPQAGGASVGRIEIDNSPVEYYNLQGVKVANPTNGLYIVRQGKKAHKVMIKK